MNAGPKLQAIELQQRRQHVSIADADNNKAAAERRVAQNELQALMPNADAGDCSQIVAHKSPM